MTTVLQEKVVAENANLKEEIKALIRENDSLKAKIGNRSRIVRMN
ncbi:hypothetical protein [Wolbachia endosymbiont of Zygogramma bicolorata]